MTSLTYLHLRNGTFFWSQLKFAINIKDIAYAIKMLLTQGGISTSCIKTGTAQTILTQNYEELIVVGWIMSTNLKPCNLKEVLETVVLPCATICRIRYELEYYNMRLSRRWHYRLFSEFWVRMNLAYINSVRFLSDGIAARTSNDTSYQALFH